MMTAAVVAPERAREDRTLRAVLAAAIVGGPLGYLVGGVFSPVIHEGGASTIGAYAGANPVTNPLHVVAFMVASFLLPLGAFGLTRLAYPVSPRLALAAGLLGVLGWMPFSALAALDGLALTMAGLPDSGSYGTLLDRFTNGPVMNSYLIIYILGHLVAYVLFGIALRRAGVLPRWAAWAMIASSPLTVAAFVLPGRPIAVGDIALALLLIGSVPAARAMGMGRDR